MADAQIVECEHAIRYRASGGKPLMSNQIFALGKNAAGDEVYMNVCIDCWQRLVGMVMEGVVRDAIRDVVRREGVKGLVGHGP